MICIIQIKIHVWKICGGEFKFKQDFPLKSNRTTIYRNVKDGKSVKSECRRVKATFNLHDNAQRAKKRKYIHTITSR